MDNNKPRNSYTRQHSTLEHIARILSGVFSPLMIPTYAFAMALWITVLSIMPEIYRFQASLVVFLITAALPMFTFLFMMRAGLVSDASIPDRKQRLIPYIVTLVCYLATALWIARLGTPSWLWMFFVGAAAIVLVQTLINHFWKISAHMASMGGLCAFLFYINAHNLAVVHMVPWICAFILIAGAVGSSRLLLKRHTPAQVYAGFLLAFALMYILVSLITS